MTPLPRLISVFCSLCDHDHAITEDEKMGSCEQRGCRCGNRIEIAE